ncbi:mannosyl-oligosaccharide glucosidase [Malassezia sp. CBS 17886]|nr:mannosyl-oligosaccharide glucosidase [Malassezia sp. CBS 17886]
MLAGAIGVVAALAGAVAGARGAAAAPASADDAHAPSTLWGTYRPQLFFGMRPRVPETLLTGLAWFSPADYRNMKFLRHQCAESEGIGRYGWRYHDGRTFGVHEVDDQLSNYRLETSFVKTGEDDAHGGNWAVRVRGTVLDAARAAELSTLFYIGAEGDRASLAFGAHAPGAALRNATVEVRGSAPELGPFSLRVVEMPGNEPLATAPWPAEAHDDAERAPYTPYVGAHLPVRQVWRAKDHLFHALVQRFDELFGAGAIDQQHLPPPAAVLQLPNRVDEDATLLAVQKSFRGNFSYDVFFTSDAAPRGAQLDAHSLSVALDAQRAAYDARFEDTFRLAQRGFAPAEVAAAREINAQLLGSIGYYHGESVVDRDFVPAHDADDDNVVHTDGARASLDPPRSLLTATPSRSGFPRGFYWDEGFHLQHIGAWDPALSMELVASWTALMDDDGWIAREQILGDEARSQVPEAFQTQYPLYGNPPTLVMGITSFLHQLHARSAQAADAVAGAGVRAPDAGAPTPGAGAHLPNATASRALLERLYAPWRRHYHWFRRTQRGQIRQWLRAASAKGEAYRWRGRSDTHVLTSGLDDYPRAATPHVGELHVDLHSWMGAFARGMRTFAEALGLDDDADEYARHERGIAANVVDLHWDDARGLFCDASVGEDDESFLECHAGYVSLFPLLTRILPADSPQLTHVLDLLGSRDALWSPHGLRSLSRQHPLYGTGEDYWRSAIWLPINYLVLGALHGKYMAEPGPAQAQAQELYQELRANVVRTVLGEYIRTGYTWEQYDAESGRGRRNHPFAGWTSLVVLIMAEHY